jgi:O-acetyl-ADP-ribose deacetylase (regulator of RNase III)
MAADERALDSIAFPAFGTGVGGFPLDECARLMLSAVREYAPRAKTVRLVRFVLFGERAYHAFAAVAERPE